MNILIVDDQPNIKVYYALEYLKMKNVQFDYKLFSNVCDTLRYIDNHLSEFDLAIIDLGLPWSKGELIRNKVEGLAIIHEILDRNIIEGLDIPIIINSTTKIEGSNGETEKEYFKEFFVEEPKLKIEHVDCLEGSWLYEFLQKI